MKQWRAGLIGLVVAAGLTVVVSGAASFPSSVKTFTTKLAGDTIQASHINDLQDEVMAVETDLLNGLQHHLLFTDNTYDIGQSGATRPRHLYLAQNATIGGTLTTSGAATLGSTLGVGSVATFGSTMTVAGAVTLTAGQVVFPAAQNASANANTLDDYEEGTWTPTLRFGGGSTGLTYSTQTGQYVKTGQMVYAQWRVILSAKGSSTGSATFAGLPFTSNTASMGACYWGSMGSSISGVLAAVDSGATTISLFKGTAATSATALADTDVGGTSELSCSAVYRASA